MLDRLEDMFEELTEKYSGLPFRIQLRIKCEPLTNAPHIVIQK